MRIKTISNLRRFNNYLTAVVIGLSIYIIITPFTPHMNLWWAQFTDDTNGYRYAGRLADSVGEDSDDLLSVPENNTLVIPSLQIDETIIESDAPEAVDLGTWRRPHTSTPDQGSNTVIVAHRFAYTHGATFYHLDKVKSGEKFAIFWNGEEYVYEVFDISTVPATAIEIEGPTDEPIVTLYTCTPIWTAENRLVVKAKLVDGPGVDDASSDPVTELGFDAIGEDSV